MAENEYLRSMTKRWTVETANIPAGVQHLIYDALKLVAEEEIRLAWGADVKDGVPCLLNAVSNMTTQVAVNHELPASYQPEVVRLFDSINKQVEKTMKGAHAGTDGFVSPIVAELLIMNFAPLKEIEVAKPLSIQDIVDLPNNVEQELVKWLTDSFDGIDATA